MHQIASNRASKHRPVGRAAELKTNEKGTEENFMDSKKITKTHAAKKNGKSAKTGKASTDLKAKLSEALEQAKKAKTKKTAKKNGKQPDLPPEGAYTVEGPVKDTAGPRFLFSVPSLHTGDDDYEHLVVAKNAAQACELLADARITEKQPHLADNPEARQHLMKIATANYLARKPSQIEPRTEPVGVLQINHHKLGIASPEVQ
jgi:hypothetical protein